MMILALVMAVAAPVVETDDGPVRGQRLPGGGAVFRGIRFAAPPTGSLRWKPPERPVRWTAPVDTIVPHAACPQPVYGDWNRSASAAGAEDCLFLDVRTPTLAAGKRLPVLVWIHGGGNRAGAGAGTVESRITDGGIVLVSIQYRLGALGFLSHPALSAEQGGHSGNYGLMDQQAALRWVHRNVARFGGDPARVTIAGESAGAQDVGLQALSPGARGLFHGVIAESGTPGFGVPPRTLAQNEALGERIVARAGMRRGAGPAAMRDLSAASIVAAQEAVDVPGLDDKSFIWLQAVVDGRFLREAPMAALAAGRSADMAIVIGVNAQEFTSYAGRDLRAVIDREFPSRAARVAGLYGLSEGSGPVATVARLGDPAMQLGTDLVFRCPTVAVSKAYSGHGKAVWQYQFAYAPPGGRVSHASEVHYVFDPPMSGEPPLQDYWLRFVQTGNPNGPRLPTWPRYDATSRRYLAFDQTGPVPRADLRGSVCEGRDVP